MAKPGMGSNLNYDGENVDFDEFYKAFGYDSAMYGWDSIQQAAVLFVRKPVSDQPNAVLTCFTGSTRFGCDCEVEIVKGQTSVKCAGNNENFPRTDGNIVQCESFSLELARATKLTRLETMVSVGNCEFSVPMLLDSGATASFINISKLPKELAEKVNKVISGQSEFNDLGLERVEVNIKSALNCQAVACARGTIVNHSGALNQTADLLSRPPQVYVNKLETDVNLDWEEEQGNRSGKKMMF
ncbi:hypothetical protein BpHYR1_004122 [Brachionus plicatilis]|uniref:Uncharacterized protein n=1 Tax=Brachionus plicatilis TaxID=10195 RepID=A0A3M7R1A3_BRAPC|nr:hypothetical protein BpHYR1_004122 [Brachionus plicatilis]